MWIRELYFCRFDPFDSCVFFDWNFYETVRTCFDSHSFVDFETFSPIQNQLWLRLGFGSNGSDPLRVHIDLDSVMISWWGMMKFWCYLCLGLEVWTVSFDSWLGILSGELVSLLFFLPPIRILWNPSPLLPSSSPIQSLHSRLQRATSGGVLAFEPRAQQFDDEGSFESLRIARNCPNLVWILLLFDFVDWIQWEIWGFLVKLLWIGAEFILGFVCVLELFCEFVGFDP